MSGTSTKSKLVTFRIRNETWDKIEQALNSPTNPNYSVADYCKQVIERYAWRHSKK